MKLNRGLPTHRLLWLACGLVVFVTLGFYSPFPSGISGIVLPLWTGLWAVVSGQVSDHAVVPILAVLLVYAVVFAVVAAAFGWMVHACLLVAGAAVKDAKKQPRPPTYGTPINPPGSSPTR